MDVPVPDADSIGLGAFALITLATTALIGVLKSTWPAFFKGKEPLMALLFPLVGVVIAKFFNAFPETTWLEAIGWALSAGLTSGVTHDKLSNPIKKLLGGLLGTSKRKDEEAPSGPPPGPAEDKPKQPEG